MGAILDYTRDLHALTELVTSGADTADILQRALNALSAVVPYDLAVVFQLEGDTLAPISAAGPIASADVRRHRLPLRRYPTLQRVLETRQSLPLYAHNHASEEGDPWDGVLDLPHGHSCMVVPLFAADRTLGLITLDRTVCVAYPPDVVRIAGVYGQLVSLAMLLADQARTLDRYRRQLKEQNRLLVEDAGGGSVACRQLEASNDPTTRTMVQLARQVATTELPVLIRGETGTGKEVVAQAIHAWSRRADGPFVKLNCSAIPEALVESELFGHVRGAFSGADRDRRGRFLTANGGTLLLDEIGDMPLSAQAKLLRVLQEGTFEPVGADTTVKVDVRVLAATHVDLEKAVRDGKFRQDLYYRLAVFPLRLAPLRERPDEAITIAERWLAEHGNRWTLSEATRQALRAAPWPGNVRELIGALQRATVLQWEGRIEPVHLGLGPTAVPMTADGPFPTFEEAERAYYEEALRRADGRLYGPGGAAELTGVKPTTLRSRMVKLGMR